jgi:hypothetical protein
MNVAGALIALGAAAILAKGMLLIFTGHDRSLVPWFGLLVTAGFVVASMALRRSVQRWRWLAWLGGGAALVGLVSSVVAVVYLLSGTIPESPRAPGLVGVSYGVMSAGVAVSLLSLGVLIARNRSLRGRWRWFPLGLIVAQLPIFIVAGAIAVVVGSEDLADGLGLVLTGLAWMLLGYAISEKSRSPANQNRT